MDFILELPFLGEMLISLITGFVAVKVREILHRTTLVVNTRGKQGFEVLPSWVKALAYKALLEAQRVFPQAKQEELLDKVCDGLKSAIKGKLDDIVIDVIRVELKHFLEGKIQE